MTMVDMCDSVESQVPEDSKTPFVHPSSFVDEPARIGAGTRIWHFCHILGGVEIGEECRIGQNVVIGPRVIVGNHVKIQNNVSVFEGVTLEDYVFCGPSVVFTNVLVPRSACPRDRETGFLATRVRYGASLGANSTILCGTNIGRFAMVGAGAVVTRDVPDHALVHGNPARQRGWACECGQPLQLDLGEANCGDCDRVYRQESPSRIVRVDQVYPNGVGHRGV